MSDPPAIRWNSRFLGSSWDKTAEDDQTAYRKETNSLQPAWTPLALPGFPAAWWREKGKKVARCLFVDFGVAVSY